MMMIKELTVSGRDDVRYIITSAQDAGGSVRVDEAVAVHSSGTQLLVSAKNGSDSCLKAVVKAVAKLQQEGAEIYACFHVDELFAERIRRTAVTEQVKDVCVICSDEAAETAERYSSFVLSVPDSDSGAFYKLSRAGGSDKAVLIIGCSGEELEAALSAISGGAERNGAEG
ncbi:MAG: hypothetical protein IJR91_08370 [Ruminococcus sp.]|nr:hypothetical protein [Ruminococcus sp.]